MDYRGVGRERAGELLILRKEEVNLHTISFSQNHFEGMIVDSCDDAEWTFCVIYGYPEEQNKKKMWELIQELVRKGKEKILIFGDLNDTIYLQEKQGGLHRLKGCGIHWVSIHVDKWKDGE